MAIIYTWCVAWIEVTVVLYTGLLFSCGETKKICMAIIVVTDTFLGLPLLATIIIKSQISWSSLHTTTYSINRLSIYTQVKLSDIFYQYT